LIFFVYPGPKGSEENQFTLRQLADWGKKIDFRAKLIRIIISVDIHIIQIDYGS